MTPAFVVDASVVVSGITDGKVQTGALRILQRLRTETAVAPAFFRLEVANVLANLTRLGKVAAADLRGLALMVDDLRIEFDRRGENQAMVELISLSRRFGLKLYDALYLELAIRTGLPLATLDNALAAAALRHRVGLLP